jgi:hypothetical protein
MAACENALGTLCACAGKEAGADDSGGEEEGLEDEASGGGMEGSDSEEGEGRKRSRKKRAVPAGGAGAGTKRKASVGGWYCIFLPQAFFASVIARSRGLVCG